MRRVFEEELESLHAHFLKMGVLVNAAIHKSIDAFVTHDKELAQQVIDEDAAINKLENDLEIECFELIALQQPVTTDLRKIVTVMKTSADLERIGDHAVSIAKSTIKVKGKKHDADIETAIAETALKVMDMVRKSWTLMSSLMSNVRGKLRRGIRRSTRPPKISMKTASNK